MTESKHTPTRAARLKTPQHKTETTTRTARKRSRACDAPPARKRIPRPAALPRISSYAVSLLNRKPATATPPTDDLRDQPIPKSWLTTRQASRRSGYSIRHIQTLCDQGFFREGEDWKQRPPRPGVSRRGHIYINPDAIKKLDWSAQ
jgi:hypothetical protein